MPIALPVFNRPTAATEKTASSATEQRSFIDACLNSVKPITFTDRHGRTHLVQIASANEITVKNSKGKDETVISLLMVEAQPETQEAGATGARLQEQFLIACLDTVTPLTLTTDKWGKNRVFLTQMQRVIPRTKKEATASEWSYVLTMVDAFGGVYLYEETEMDMAATITTTRRTAYTALYDDAQALYGLCVYG